METPKEKAIELVGKMCLNNCTDKNIEKSKKYALIAIDLAIEYNDFHIEFLQEVKEEIKLL